MKDLLTLSNLTWHDEYIRISFILDASPEETSEYQASNSISSAVPIIFYPHRIHQEDDL
ncbi:hypothetical protein RO3G_00152 [Rhizopus delemar RA 99-880]|uniref:Uncharacterized protein n=1 Tax=Rhizopus delemar (strain RA 99-880 / ATCC MYA-4621 / FGSC 9543 / NRRL 43880) TaxID=246409 RepID=I1BGW8_RHIO9|nr:hypothetical protein RO3G_00152 [Rhizopus delemar RA 99-880]|eukprot:EIE75448.1 hypothetical protein RO3G_00152 [Rhizopus delemar RA 99-880]